MKKITLKAFIICTTIILLASSLTQAQNEGRPREIEVVNLIPRRPLQMGDLVVTSNRVGLYEKFEIIFDLNGEWDNPFYPEQIKADATFTNTEGKNFLYRVFYKDYRFNKKTSGMQSGWREYPERETENNHHELFRL